MKKITLSTFRRMNASEEAMMRAVMPRTSEADAAPLETAFHNVPRQLRAVRGGLRLVRVAPLTATVAEVANA